MNTQILAPTAVNIMRCASRLKTGGLVAFPTETVYALGAAATNAAAVKKVYDVKRRPPDKPLIVAVADKKAIDTVAVNIPEKARILIEKFMPGPLTLLLDRAPSIPDEVTAGKETVAVRIPANDIAKKLIELASRPIVVPSANTSDKSSATLAAHVKDDLDGKIEFIIDGGPSEIGIESTMIDPRTDPPTVVRRGGVSVEDIERVIGKVAYRCDRPAPQSYVPVADVLFSAFYDGMTDNIRTRYDMLDMSGKTAAIICLDGNADAYGDRRVYKAGASYADYAHNLFALLRKADAEHIDTVIAEGVESAGIGATLIARLIKISNGQII